MKFKKILLLAFCTWSLCAPFSLAHAADSIKDIKTIAKALGFIKGGPSGTLTMDILYDPNNPDSVKHADEIAALTARAVGSKVKLEGRKTASLNSATSQVIFITRGATSLYNSALQKAVQNKGLTISTDEACLEIGCVLVVKTKPRVDILLSTKAAEQTNTEFAAAFSMMIKKR